MFSKLQLHIKNLWPSFKNNKHKNKKLAIIPLIRSKESYKSLLSCCVFSMHGM